MQDKKVSIKLKCLFCDCVLQGESDQELKSGDMCKCQNCGESNDYDALVDVAMEEGMIMAEEYAKTELDKILKKHLK